LKILTFGAGGMLEQDIVKAFAHNELIRLFETELDITKEQKVIDKIADIMPDIVINCAAYTNVDLCERERELSYKVNALGAKNIAKGCKATDCTMVYYSTDYIFDGTKGSPYVESDATVPINYYGETKLAGENFVRSILDKHYIIRTQWLFGVNGRNFVKTMLELTKTKDTICVVDDQIGSPTYAKDLAEATALLVNSKPFGTYHITNSNAVSWCRFAQDIFEISNLDIKVIPITSDEMPRPAKRPLYSVLSNSNWSKIGLNPLRDYKEALAEYLLKEEGV